MFHIDYPDIDPVAFMVGSLPVYWYGLAYLFGFFFAWLFIRQVLIRDKGLVQAHQIDSLLFWAALGLIVGARLGEVLFYYPTEYWQNPSRVLDFQNGGMSFHGGLIGVVLAIIFVSRRSKLPFLVFADLVTAAAPIGLFSGRIANFINGELYGRATDVSWAMVFPRGGAVSRHPSQLYEAGLEGVTLFALMCLLWTRYDTLRKPGLTSGGFLVGYALLRSFAEIFREPELSGQVLGVTITMGQMLCLPMLVAGLWLIRLNLRSRPRIPDNDV